MEIRSTLGSVPGSGAVGSWSSFYFTVNTMIGSGFLTLPWAFSQAGWLFSTCFLIFGAVESYIMGIQMLDIMSKTEAIIQVREEGNTVRCQSLLGLFLPYYTQRLLPKPSVQPEIRRQRGDISECIRVLFGNTAGAVYIVTFFIYMEGAQLAAGAIFASSFASIVPLGNQETCDIYDDALFTTDCTWKYWVWLLIFSCIVTFFVLKGMKEQQTFQAVMCFMRFFVILLIICCCFKNAVTHTQNSSSEYNPATWPPLAKFEHIGQSIPVLIMCLLFQTNIPTIIEHVQHKEKTLKFVIGSALVCTTLLYTGLCLIGPLGIQDPPSLFTLGFRNYSSGHSLSDRPWWTYPVEYVVLLFPALEMLSSFPLMSLAASDNLVTVFFGKDLRKCGLYAVRLAACLPPLILGAFLYDLGQILDWVGLFGLVLMPISIQLMQLAANRVIRLDSPYSSFCSHPVRVIQIVCYFLFFSNVVFFFLTLALNIQIES